MVGLYDHFLIIGGESEFTVGRLLVSRGHWIPLKIPFQVKVFLFFFWKPSNDVEIGSFRSSEQFYFEMDGNWNRFAAFSSFFPFLLK